MKLKLHLLACLITASALHMSEAQPLKALYSEVGHPLSKVYTPADYNANGQNFAITQDTKGIMYMGNFAGVLAYDGAVWENIPTENISRVSALYTSKKGEVYVGANGEFGYLAPDSVGRLSFKSLSKGVSKRIDPIIQIVGQAEGIYFISKSTWYVWDGKKVKQLNNPFETISAFHFGNGILVHTRQKGIQVFENGNFSALASAADFSTLLDVVSLVELGPGNALLLTSNKGIFKVTGSRLEMLASEANATLVANRASFACLLSDGNVAVSMLTGGLLILSKDGILQYPVFAGGAVQESQISYMYNDRDGNLWLALNDGIAKLSIPSLVTRFDPMGGLKGEVTSITRFDNKIHVGTLYGLFAIENNRVHQVSNFKGSILAFSKIGSDLAIATNRGVILWNPRSGERKLSSEFALSLTSSASGNVIYVGLQNGVEILSRSGNGWQNSRIPGLQDQIVGIMEIGNELWLETMSAGLMKWDLRARTLKVYGVKEGITSPLYNKISLYGAGLIMTNKDGAFRYNRAADRFEKTELLAKGGEDIDWFDKLVADRNGNFWVTRGDKREFAMLKKPVAGKSGFTIFKKPFRPIAEISFQEVYPDLNDVVWVGGDQGLFRLDNKVVRNYAYNYPVLIRKITSNGGKELTGQLYGKAATRSGMKKVNVNYKENNVAIEYALPSYHLNQEVEYQLILENYDPGWSEWTTLTRKEYNGLPPGNYVFRVRARDVFGTVSGEANFAISIPTPWYMTWWMYIIYAVLFAFAIYYVVRLRLLRVLREKQGLENLIRERTEEVVVQKEELEAQSEELSSTNDQLERIDEFVKSINGEVNTRKLFQLVLDKLCLFQNVDSASGLIHNKATDSYQFIALAGAVRFTDVKDVKLTYEQAAQRYLYGGEEVFEDIFLKNNFKYENLNSSIDEMYAPKSLITILIRVEGSVKSFVTLENMDHENAFGARDFNIVKNLKEHLIGAYIKTDILENLESTLSNLKSTQAELIRQERLASVGQLTKGIVDRILNPLNYINNFSQSSAKLVDEVSEVTDRHVNELPENDRDDLEDGLAMLKKNLEKIYEHGASTTRIVKDMQKLLKGKSNEFFITELNPFLESKARSAIQEVIAEQKGVSVDLLIDLDPNSVKVSLLPHEFTQVLTNLFSNAYYTVIEKGRLLKDFKPEIKVTSLVEGDMIKVVIADNGKGMPPKETEQLFNPFFTTKPTSKGTGLGLFMSKDIIEYHKGRMSIRSEDGKFTEVSIYLPIA